MDIRFYLGQKLPKMIPKLFLPFNPPQARREFGSVGFMVGNTLATMSVTGTAFLCTGTIDGVMWTMGHGGYYIMTWQ